MFAATLLALSALSGPQITWTAPGAYLGEGPYRAQLELVAPEGGATVVGWLLTPAAFTVDGEPLQKREDRGSMQLPAGARLSVELNLGPYLEPLEPKGEFELRFAKEYFDGASLEVAVLTPAEKGLDFEEMSEKELAKYAVHFSTNRGDLVFELWPKDAPTHVRNFLELVDTDFYDGTLFHRVGVDFMVQGGCPNTKGDDVGSWGLGDGPRRLELEKSRRKHVPGVLSMARNEDPNSASCQFFVVHGRANKGLDGEYSAFGRLTHGEETLDRIATCERGEAVDAYSYRPKTPQRVLQARVVLAN